MKLEEFVTKLQALLPNYSVKAAHILSRAGTRIDIEQNGIILCFFTGNWISSVTEEQIETMAHSAEYSFGKGRE